MAQHKSNAFWTPPIVGMLMLVAGAFTGPVTFEVFSRFLRHEGVALGIAWAVAGVTWFFLDIAARRRSIAPAEESRLFSKEVGGVIRGWPVWMCGFAATILGILLAAKVI